MAVQGVRKADNAETESSLVIRARAGDRKAEELLYRAHVTSVHALATRLLGRHDEADDVVQDAFVTALSRLRQLRDPSSFRGWLLRITVREVHRRFRRRKLLRALGISQESEEPGLLEQARPMLPAEARAELAALDRALATLPSRERVAWLLRHVEGLELTEVASACDTSLATIKRWLARAEACVREHCGASP
jgi:RNA polymerase sigma-70 factor, ECF subfamily